ncbi:putative MFS family arabinose efflux permease [Streptacidiphilus sp. MAP12-16]|uniref:MFS transporter n=1 Tax=Streptacidiphilus sp. MAP12-16 TaxID=3156300 RepID=UPI00351315C8
MPQHPAGRSVLAVLGFGGITATLVQTAVVPLLPDLPRLTRSSPADVGWVVTVTLLAGAIATPVLGRAGDMFGKRRMLLAALTALTLGSLVCALTSNLGVLIAARALQGVGAAVIPLSVSVLRDILPRERIGSAVALMSSTVGIGAAVGLPLAALLVQYADWHLMFWATTALAALALALAWRVVQETPTSGSTRDSAARRFDLLGALGLAVALTGALLAVSKGGDWGWTSPRVCALVVLSLAVGAGWVRRQLHTAEPLVDLRLTARPAVALPNLAALLAGFAFYANSLVTAQLVQAPRATGYGLGLGVAAAGLCLLPSGVLMVAFAPLSARISAARGARTTLALGALVIASGYLLRIADSRQLVAVIVGAAVVSTGTALAYSALPTLIMQAVPQQQTAAANGLNVLMRTIGQAVCSAAVAAVLTRNLVTSGGVTAPALDGYRTAFAMAGGVALLACVAACAIPRRRGDFDLPLESSRTTAKAGEPS